MVDNLGRAGSCLRPMKAHFSADLMMKMAKAGHSWSLLPPTGCEANPVELVNGQIQRLVANAKPDDSYMGKADSANTLGGCTCQPQLLFLLNRAIDTLNMKTGFLSGCYRKRAGGKRLEHLVLTSAAGQAVLASRARRRELGLPLPQRMIFPAHMRRTFETTSGQIYDLQSLTDLATQKSGNGVPRWCLGSRRSTDFSLLLLPSTF